MYCLSESICQWSLSKVLFSNYSMNTSKYLQCKCHFIYYHVMVIWPLSVPGLCACKHGSRADLWTVMLGDHGARHVPWRGWMNPSVSCICLNAWLGMWISWNWILNSGPGFWIQDITHMHACQACELLESHLIKEWLDYHTAWQSHKVKSWLQSKNPDPSYTRLSIHEFLIENNLHSAVTDNCSHRSEQSWWAGFSLSDYETNSSSWAYPESAHRRPPALCTESTVLSAWPNPWLAYILNAFVLFVLNLYMYLQDAICKGLTVCTCSPLQFFVHQMSWRSYLWHIAAIIYLSSSFQNFRHKGTST